MDENQLLADQPLGEKLIKKGFWLYFFMIITAPVWYIIKVLISNSISVEDVWIIYSIIWFIWILSAYHDLWLTEALQYHLPKYRIQKQYNEFKTSIYFTLIIQILTGIIISCILFFWANYLSVNYFHTPESVDVIKIFCIYFLGLNFYNMLYSIFVSFQDVIQAKLLEFIRYYATLIFTICFFVIGGLNIVSFTWWRVIWIICALLFSGIIFLKKYRYTVIKWNLERTEKLFKKQIKYAFRVFIWTNISILLSQIDLQFVIYFLGTKEAWYYTNYLSLIFSFATITAPILWYIFPLTTELIEKKEYEKINQFKNILYKYFSVFALSVWGFFFVLWPEIATILFWKKFIYSGTLLMYSSPFLIFYVLYNINFWFLAWMWKVRERAKIILIALVINIILNFILIKFFWSVGVMIATMISWVVLFIMSYKPISNQKEITFNWLFLFKNIFGVIIICFIIYLFKNNVFILEDTYRYRNLLYFLLITLWYCLYVLGINYKNIILVKRELKNNILQIKK